MTFSKKRDPKKLFFVITKSVWGGASLPLLRNPRFLTRSVTNRRIAVFLHGETRVSPTPFLAPLKIL
jgi:hypothetical protein